MLIILTDISATGIPENLVKFRHRFLDIDKHADRKTSHPSGGGGEGMLQLPPNDWIPSRPSYNMSLTTLTVTTTRRRGGGGHVHLHADGNLNSQHVKLPIHVEIEAI